jgi:hypothetical protein
MNKKIAAISSFLLFLILAFPMLGAVYAQQQIQGISGLSEGSTFTYSNTLLWNSTNPSDFPPLSLVAENQSTWQINVNGVHGGTIEFQKLVTYKNGSQVSSDELDEVNAGIVNDFLMFASNLTAGGMLFPMASDKPFIINGTEFRGYNGNFRDTNHIEVNNTGLDGYVYSYLNLWFDRQTGICVEFYITSVYTSTPNQAVTQHLVLTASSVWSVSAASSGTPTSTPQTSSQSSSNPTPTPVGTTPTDQFPTSLVVVIAVVVVVIVVAGFILLPKGKPKPKQKPESKEPQENQEAPKEKSEKEPQGKPEEDSYSI